METPREKNIFNKGLDTKEFINSQANELGSDVDQNLNKTITEYSEDEENFSENFPKADTVRISPQQCFSPHRDNFATISKENPLINNDLKMDIVANKPFDSNHALIGKKLFFVKNKKKTETLSVTQNSFNNSEIMSQINKINLREIDKEKSDGKIIYLPLTYDTKLNDMTNKIKDYLTEPTNNQSNYFQEDKILNEQENKSFGFGQNIGETNNLSISEILNKNEQSNDLVSYIKKRQIITQKIFPQAEENNSEKNINSINSENNNNEKKNTTQNILYIDYKGQNDMTIANNQSLYKKLINSFNDDYKNKNGEKINQSIFSASANQQKDELSVLSSELDNIASDKIFNLNFPVSMGREKEERDLSIKKAESNININKNCYYISNNIDNKSLSNVDKNHQSIINKSLTANKVLTQPEQDKKKPIFSLEHKPFHKTSRQDNNKSSSNSMSENSDLEDSNSELEESIGSNMQNSSKLPKQRKEGKGNQFDLEEYKSGRWTNEEHVSFLEAIFLFSNNWKQVQKHIKTRSSTQARSHAQKFFISLKKKILDKLKHREQYKESKEISKEMIENLINGYIEEIFMSKIFLDIPCAERQDLLSQRRSKLISLIQNILISNTKNKKSFFKCIDSTDIINPSRKSHRLRFYSNNLNIDDEDINNINIHASNASNDIKSLIQTHKRRKNSFDALKNKSLKPIKSFLKKRRRNFSFGNNNRKITDLTKPLNGVANNFISTNSPAQLMKKGINTKEAALKSINDIPNMQGKNFHSFNDALSSRKSSHFLNNTLNLSDGNYIDEYKNNFMPKFLNTKIHADHGNIIKNGITSANLKQLKNKSEDLIDNNKNAKLNLKKNKNYKKFLNLDDAGIINSIRLNPSNSISSHLKQAANIKSDSNTNNNIDNTIQNKKNKNGNNNNLDNLNTSKVINFNLSAISNKELNYNSLNANKENNTDSGNPGNNKDVNKTIRQSQKHEHVTNPNHMKNKLFLSSSFISDGVVEMNNTLSSMNMDNKPFFKSKNKKIQNKNNKLNNASNKTENFLNCSELASEEAFSGIEGLNYIHNYNGSSNLLPVNNLENYESNENFYNTSNNNINYRNINKAKNNTTNNSNNNLSFEFPTIDKMLKIFQANPMAAESNTKNNNGINENGNKNNNLLLGNKAFINDNILINNNNNNSVSDKVQLNDLIKSNSFKNQRPGFSAIFNKTNINKVFSTYAKPNKSVSNSACESNHTTNNLEKNNAKFLSNIDIDEFLVSEKPNLAGNIEDLFPKALQGGTNTEKLEYAFTYNSAKTFGQARTTTLQEDKQESEQLISPMGNCLNK